MEDEGTSFSRAGTRRALTIGILVTGLGAATGYLLSHEKAPSQEGRARRPGAGADMATAAPAPDVTALLAPLAVGGTLENYEIIRIHPVEAGIVRIDLARGTTKATLEIALDDPGGHNAPVVAGRYAIFYEGPGGRELAAAMGALEQVLKKNQDTAVPAGMKAPGKADRQHGK